MKHKLTLGVTVNDRITGFKGTVTGLVSYVTGCDQALVTPRCKDGEENKLPEGTWLDVNRLEVDPAVAPVVMDAASKDVGACQAPPVK